MTNETCPGCNGTGNDERDEGYDSKKYPCGDCNGTGEAPGMASVDAAEDSARLDWMEANPNRIKRSIGYLGAADSWAFTDRSGRGIDATSLRSAIDAARQESK